MSKPFIQIVSLLILPCLVGDPALASAGSRSLEYSVKAGDGQLFQQEAFIERTLWDMHSLAQRLAARLRLQGGHLRLQRIKDNISPPAAPAAAITIPNPDVLPGKPRGPLGMTLKNEGDDLIVPASQARASTSGPTEARSTIDFYADSPTRVAGEMIRRIPELSEVPFQERLDMVDEIREQVLSFEELGRIERLQKALGVSAQQVPIKLAEYGFTAHSLSTTQRLLLLSEQIISSLNRPLKSPDQWVVSQLLISSFCNLLMSSSGWLRLVRSTIGASSIDKLKRMLQDAVNRPRKAGYEWHEWRRALLTDVTRIVYNHAAADLTDSKPGEFTQSEVSGAILHFLWNKGRARLLECLTRLNGYPSQGSDVDQVGVKPFQKGDYSFIVPGRAKVKGTQERFLIEAATRPEFNEVVARDFQNRQFLYRNVSAQYLPKPLLLGEEIVPNDRGNHLMALAAYELLENYRPLHVLLLDGKVWLRVGKAADGQKEQLFEIGARPDIWHAVGHILGTYAMNSRHATIDSLDFGRADYAIKEPSPMADIKLVSARTLTNRKDDVEALALQVRAALLPRFISPDHIVRTVSLPDFLPALQGFYEGVGEQWQRQGKKAAQLPQIMADSCKKTLDGLDIETPTEADLQTRVTHFLAYYSHVDHWEVVAGPIAQPELQHNVIELRIIQPLWNQEGQSLAEALDVMGDYRPGGQHSRNIFHLWDPNTETTQAIPYADFIGQFQNRETLPIPKSQVAYVQAVSGMTNAELDAELQQYTWVDNPLEGSLTIQNLINGMSEALSLTHFLACAFTEGGAIGKNTDNLSRWRVVLSEILLRWSMSTISAAQASGAAGSSLGPPSAQIDWREHYLGHRRLRLPVSPALREIVDLNIFRKLPLRAKVLELGSGLGMMYKWLSVAGNPAYFLFDWRESDTSLVVFDLPERLHNFPTKKDIVNLPDIGGEPESLDAIVGLRVLDTLSLPALEATAAAVWNRLKFGGTWFHFLDLFPNAFSAPWRWTFRWHRDGDSAVMTMDIPMDAMGRLTRPFP